MADQGLVAGPIYKHFWWEGFKTKLPNTGPG